MDAVQTAPLFELADKSVRYDDHVVLNNISVSVQPGERIALVGQSGAGKTTLLKILYEQQQTGTSLVPQELGLVRSLSVFHNIFMGRLDKNSSLYNLANLIKPFKTEVSEVTQIVRRVGLEDKLFTATGELSGGQRQRTAIGRALYRGASIFMGDEPVSAVDELQSRDVLEAIANQHETTILALHDVQLALAFSSRVIGLRNGKLELDAPTAGMKASDLDGLYRT